MISHDSSFTLSITSLQKQQEDLFTQANHIGVHTELFARYIYQQESYKTIDALHRLLCLKKHYNETRLESACQRALFYGCYDFAMVNLILKHRLDRLPLSSDSDVFGQLFLDFHH